MVLPMLLGDPLLMGIAFSAGEDTAVSSELERSAIASAAWLSACGGGLVLRGVSMTIASGGLLRGRSFAS
jgi:hypothetical protein